MRKLFAGSILMMVLVACNNEADTGKTNEGDSSNAKTGTAMSILTEQEKADGWQVLFDGQTSNGWHKYGGGPVGTAWKIVDGAFYLDTTSKEGWQTKGGGDIITDEEFENFHMKLEWKIAPKGNSGLMFYIHEDTVKYKWPWQSAPEVQVVDNEGNADGRITKHKAGDLYDLISCSKENAKPAGEWNQAEIKCVNGKLDLWLNGESLVSTTLWDDNWKKLVAGSKFVEMPGFGTYKKGKLGLQDHGNSVWYRNIRVKRL